MTDYERTRYYHIKLGEGENATFIRIKRSQDILIQAADALGEFLGEVFTGYEDDDLGRLVGVGQEILSGAFLDVTQTVFSPVMDAANNRTWFGGEIEDYTMQELPETSRYEEDTPEIFRWEQRSGTRGNQLFPLDLQYITHSTAAWDKLEQDFFPWGPRESSTENILNLLASQTLISSLTRRTQ